jgi:3-oxoacyl-[acyl-carrier-protein] synthase-3
MTTGTASAVVSGLGSWLPPLVITNDQLAGELDTSDDWILSRTGIRSRHLVEPGMSTGDLAVEAGSLALKAAGTTQVDAVVLATTTPDRRCPATAPDIAYRLGLAGVAAFDVSAVCAGFVYGMASAAGLIAAGAARQVLLIGAEAYSTILHPGDRTTRSIFGDGAGALVLRAGQATEPGAIGPCVLGSDGARSDLIMIPAGGARQRSAGTQAAPEDFYFQMRGRDVYRHAVDRMTSCAQEAMQRAGWAAADVDRLVPHQANARISGAVADRLGIDPGRRLSNIEHVGNTAAASVPLLLTEAAADGRLQPGHRVLIVAFGGGLAWGATSLIWPDVAALALTGAPAGPLPTP